MTFKWFIITFPYVVISPIRLFFIDEIKIIKKHMFNLIESFHVYLYIQYDEQNQLRVTLSIPRYFSCVERNTQIIFLACRCTCGVSCFGKYHHLPFILTFLSQRFTSNTQIILSLNKTNLTPFHCNKIYFGMYLKKHQHRFTVYITIIYL